MPSTVTADAKTPVVLYGQGFGPNTKIHLGSDLGYLASILYVSPEGKVLVFVVPTHINAGAQAIYVRNPDEPAKQAGSIVITK